MMRRFWLWLLLPLLFSPRMATAQNDNPPPLKESHRNLPGGVDPTDAEEMMTQRLGELHELHQLQDQVQELLEKIPKEDLRRMRAKLLKGEGLSQDPNWKQVLKQAKAQGKLNQRQIDLLNGWAKRAEQNLPPNPSGGMTFDNIAKNAPLLPPSSPLAPSSSPPSLPTPDEPAPSLLDRLQEETTRWLIENFEDVSGDVLQALTEMGNKGNTPLAEMLRSLPKSDSSGINVREHPLVPALRSGTFARYLSNAGDFFHRQNGVWDKVGSLFHKAPLPSLRVPAVSMRTPSAPESDGWLPALLSLLMLGVIALFICKKGFGWKLPNGPGEDAEWRLGSWPVSPGAVSTRQDVIRAFEYLALLCLGPAAAACHHRQLAASLAELPPHPPRHGGDGGGTGRRQAAEMLAELYERARYAPAEEALSQEQISDARRALCSLAGVTAA